MIAADRTHDPRVKSWIEVPDGSHFPIQNLPYCSYLSERASEGSIAVRIGDMLIDLYELCEGDLLHGFDNHFCFDLQDTLTHAGRAGLRKVREQLFDLLQTDNPTLRDNKELRERAVCRLDEAEILMPVTLNAFVDFYSGIHHASNVGKMFRPDMQPLLPNYRHLPVGYNGRASSVIVSGDPVRRPKGQTKAADSDMPAFGPTKELDFELELGFITGKGNEIGDPVSIEEAEEYIFGTVLVNDWSARDVQRWEYQPLGPFLAKSFATSISPWVVTLDALEPWRVPGPEQDPEPLAHLKAKAPGHFDIQLEVYLKTPAMKKPQRICTSNSKYLYWSFAQQIAHQTSNGTPIEPADLYATGTISGEEEGSFGSLLELTWKGSKSITMNETGETRTFLEDGDELTITGYCQGDGYRVGYGEVTAQILPAKP